MAKADEVRLVLVVAGPSASGKSALAADIAAAYSGVVINADSMQVYRGLDILTSAPNAALKSKAPHKLFSILPPDVSCTAGDWRRMAIAEIDMAHQFGQLPVIVGGSGLYLRSLMTGIAKMPSIPTEVRHNVRGRLQALGSTALHEELWSKDPKSAARLSVNDGQRICRALEVFESTGRGLLDWHTRGIEPNDVKGLKFITILLMPPRDELYEACNERFCRMLEKGAIEEVRELSKLDLAINLPSMKALGVSQILGLLRGSLSLEEVIQGGQQATRRYVKRQFTWFRHQIIADFIIESKYNESLRHDIFSKISKIMLTSGL